VSTYHAARPPLIADIWALTLSLASTSKTSREVSEATCRALLAAVPAASRTCKPRDQVRPANEASARIKAPPASFAAATFRGDETCRHEKCRRLARPQTTLSRGHSGTPLLRPRHKVVIAKPK